MQQSFIEKLNNANFGKKGIYIAIATFVSIILIKLLIAPKLAPYYSQKSWQMFRAIVDAVELVCMLNFLAFFACMFFFREKIGGKLAYAMQLRDTTYFKDKWILWWLKSFWVGFIIIGITTVIKQSLFKPWSSFFWLIIMLSIPFFLLPKLRNRRMY